MKEQLRKLGINGPRRPTKADVAAVNRSLGSAKPDETSLEPLSRSDFEVFLKQPTDDPEAVRLWVRRIIRGHEREFPGLTVADNSVSVTDEDPHDSQTQPTRRRTGT